MWLNASSFANTARQYAFGRQRREFNEEDEDGDYDDDYAGGYGDYGNYGNEGDDSDESEDDVDDERNCADPEDDEKKVIAEMGNIALDDKQQYS